MGAISKRPGSTSILDVQYRRDGNKRGDGEKRSRLGEGN